MALFELILHNWNYSSTFIFESNIDVSENDLIVAIQNALPQAIVLANKLRPNMPIDSIDIMDQIKNVISPPFSAPQSHKITITGKHALANTLQTIIKDHNQKFFKI